MAVKKRRKSPTQPANPWKITPEWEGSTVFVACGGTSVTPTHIEMLRGQKIIVVNSMYTLIPWADMLFFADIRWWRRECTERPAALSAFRGRIVTTSRAAVGDRLLRVKHIKPPPGIAPSTDCVAMARTSLCGACNVAVHLGAARLVLVGADNRDGKDGRAHCHPEYPWNRPPHTWKVKEKELYQLYLSLDARKIPVYNCSPISTLPWWPFADLAEMVKSDSR